MNQALIHQVLISFCVLLGLNGQALADSHETTRVHAGYEKGFFLQDEDGNFRLGIGTRVQSRFTYEGVDGINAGGADESQFSIPRARLTLKGHAFNPDLKFKFQTDYGKGFLSLKDFFVNYKLSSAVQLRIGQWKRPFSRQQINSSSKLAMVDRSITKDQFGAGRDIGIGLDNNYEKSPVFEWAVCLFNGASVKPSVSGSVSTDPDTGESSITSGTLSNVPEQVSPFVVARVGYNHGGIKGYSEGDFQGGGLRFSVGASVMADLKLVDDSSSGTFAQLDYVVKAHGFSTTGGVYVSTLQDGEGLADQSLSKTGFHIQAGYLIGKRYQPVVRYAKVMPDGGQDIQEIAAGFSMYFYKHNVKWQNDFALLQTGDADADQVVRSQLQFYF
jgi:hypothetical protein